MSPKKKIEVPSLTLKKSTAEVPKLQIRGLEKLSSKLRARVKEIKQLEEEQKNEESVLLDTVKNERIDAEKKGSFYKTCLVLSEEEDQPVRVTFSNKFSKIKEENEPILRECLGPLYDELYVNVTLAKVRDDVSVQTLKEKLGEELYTMLFVEEKFIGHREDFLENRAKLRQKLSAKTMDVVDQLTDQTICKAGISYKG